jgi:hypothetical protein
MREAHPQDKIRSYSTESSKTTATRARLQITHCVSQNGVGRLYNYFYCWGVRRLIVRRLVLRLETTSSGSLEVLRSISIRHVRKMCSVLSLKLDLHSGSSGANCVWAGHMRKKAYCCEAASLTERC